MSIQLPATRFGWIQLFAIIAVVAGFGYMVLYAIQSDMQRSAHDKQIAKINCQDKDFFNRNFNFCYENGVDTP